MRWVAFFLALCLIGCGGSFSPGLLKECDSLVMPAKGAELPQVGKNANPAENPQWTGKVLLVNIPYTADQHAQPHPAMEALDSSLKAKGDSEVATVGYVMQDATRLPSGGSGRLWVVLVDWKSKQNLGTVKVKEWTDKSPEKADYEQTYPELAKKLKELHH